MKKDKNMDEIMFGKAYYKLQQGVITNCDSSLYYKLRQGVVTNCDSTRLQDLLAFALSQFVITVVAISNTCRIL